MINWSLKSLRLGFFFFLSLYLLIAVHEMGHLAVGTYLGLDYELYSVGSGPVIVDTVLDSGIRVHFGLFPSGGVCKMTEASVSRFMKFPPHEQISSLLAGVTASSVFAWLLLGLSLRLKDNGGRVQQALRSFWPTLGVVVISPILPFFILLYVLGYKTFRRWTARFLLAVFRVLEINGSDKLWSLRNCWTEVTVTTVAVNAYFVAMNVAPLSEYHDGTKALYFLLNNSLGDFWIYTTVSIWIFFLYLGMLFIFWRVVVLFLEMVLWFDQEHEEKSVSPSFRDYLEKLSSD